MKCLLYLTESRLITLHVDCVVENADASKRELRMIRYDATGYTIAALKRLYEM